MARPAGLIRTAYSAFLTLRAATAAQFRPDHLRDLSNPQLLVGTTEIAISLKGLRPFREMARPAGLEPATLGLAYHYHFRGPASRFGGLDYLFAITGVARIVSTDPRQG